MSGCFCVFRRNLVQYGMTIVKGRTDHMTKEKIARINELAKKSRTEQGLTEEEKTEQATLRKEYIDEMKQSLRSQLDHADYLDEKGVRRPVSERKKKN